jgi:hypothetical protein
MVSLWLMNGSTVQSKVGAWIIENDSVIQGVGDFDGDGRSDIVWRENSSGKVTLWLMNGGIVQSKVGNWVVGRDWMIQGIGDFNGDGKSDILWRNTITGAVEIWFINGGSVIGIAGPWPVSSDWMIQGIGDFDGDGKKDILWRNTTTGAVKTWLINTDVIKEGGPWTAPSNWMIQGVGDFNGDGISDILWRDPSTGMVTLWLMEGGTIKSKAGAWIVSSDWVVQGIGDFDGDRKKDILWRNTQTGAVEIWFMNGATVTGIGGPWPVSRDWVIQESTPSNLTLTLQDYLPVGQYTNTPFVPVAAESTRYAIPSSVSPDCNVVSPSITSPSVKVDDFGARGDGVTDDTAAIIRAIQSLSSGGGTVVFTPGKTYLKRGVVAVTSPGIKLWGYRSTVFSVVTDQEVLAGKGVAGIAFTLLAPRTGMYGLTMISNLRKRLIGHPYNAAVYMASDSQEVVDNRFEYTGNGVFVTGTNAVISRNVIYRTWADGIHLSHDVSKGLFAKSGRVMCNTIRQTGDDMIAVVGYGIGEPRLSNFLIAGNSLADQYWGRGITISGARDVTIRNNNIAGTMAAGIFLASEPVFKTSNVHNVIVEENDISRIQMARPPWDPIAPQTASGQGAIDIHGYSASQVVTGVLVRNNNLHEANKDAIFIRDNSSNIGLVGNTAANIGRSAVNIGASVSATIYCSGNKLNGAPATSAGCKASVPPAVTGSSF